MSDLDDLLNDTLCDISAVISPESTKKTDSDDVLIEDGAPNSTDDSNNIWEDDARKALHELFESSKSTAESNSNIPEFGSISKEDAESFSKFMVELGFPEMDPEMYYKVSRGEMDGDTIEKMSKMFGLSGNDEDMDKVIQEALATAQEGMASGSGDKPKDESDEGCTQQ